MDEQGFSHDRIPPNQVAKNAAQQSSNARPVDQVLALAPNLKSTYAAHVASAPPKHVQQDEDPDLTRAYVAAPVIAWAYFAAVPYRSTKTQFLDPFGLWRVPHSWFSWWILVLVCATALVMLITLLTVYWSSNERHIATFDNDSILGSVVGFLANLIPFGILCFALFVVTWMGVRILAANVGGFRLYGHAIGTPLLHSIVAFVFVSLVVGYLIFALGVGKEGRDGNERLVVMVCLLLTLLAILASADWWLSQVHRMMFVVEQPLARPPHAIVGLPRSLDKMQSAYFALTSFTTLGLGDVRPADNPARLLVTIQSVVGFGLIGIAIALVVGKVQQGKHESGPVSRDGDSYFEGGYWHWRKGAIRRIAPYDAEKRTHPAPLVWDGNEWAEAQWVDAEPMRRIDRLLKKHGLGPKKLTMPWDISEEDR